MTKTELAAKIAQQLHISNKLAHEIVTLVFQEMKNELLLGTDQKVMISGFGTFSRKKYAECKKQVFGTGSVLTIPAHTKVVFRPSKAWKTEVDEKIPSGT